MASPNHVVLLGLIFAGLVIVNIISVFLGDPANSKPFEDCVRMEIENGKLYLIHYVVLQSEALI